MELLGHSGQPVKDMQRSMAMEPLDALEMSLRARHLAPTAPDTLPTQPFEDADPFVLEATPHVLFSGGHERAQHRWHGGQQGTQRGGLRAVTSKSGFPIGFQGLMEPYEALSMILIVSLSLSYTYVFFRASIQA